MLTRSQADKLVKKWNKHKTPNVGDPPDLLTSLNTAVADVGAFDMASGAYAAALSLGDQAGIDAALAVLDAKYTALQGDRTPVDAGFANIGINS